MLIYKQGVRKQNDKFNWKGIFCEVKINQLNEKKVLSIFYEIIGYVE